MIAAVVPTRNEEATIAKLVRHLKGITENVVVIDDDSHDMTALCALSEGADVHIAETSGLGPAYLEAWAKIPADEYVVHVDAGGSHPISSIRAVVHHARDADIVIGSRFCPGGRHAGPLPRRVGSQVMAAAMNLATWFDIKDWTSGLRSYSPRARAFLSSLDYQTVGHAWQMETLFAARTHGLTVKEVPIDYLPSGSSLSWSRTWEAIVLWWGVAWS